MALNLTSPDLSNVESGYHYAVNTNFVGCKAVVVNSSAENNTSPRDRLQADSQQLSESMQSGKISVTPKAHARQRSCYPAAPD